MATIKGFIIAGDKQDYYLHRSGSWVKYDDVAKAYVWSKEEVDAILKEFDTVKEGIKPKKLFPATFVQPSGGLTTVEGNEIEVKGFQNSFNVSGNVLNSSSIRSTYNIIAGSHHL